MKKLVIKDIAKLARVSSSTVSKAINNYSDIPEKTKKKIKEIINKLNYFPSKSARTLRKGKNETIGFISGRLSSHFSADVLSAIEKRTFITGKYVHSIIPYSTNYDRNVAEDIFKKILYGREVSALIALAMNPAQQLLDKYKNAGIPIILIENMMKNAHCVNIDNNKAGFLAAEYLIKKGRKKIALICGGIKEGSRCGFSYAAVERKAGFDKALDSYGLKFNKKNLEFSAHYTIEEGIELFDKLLKNGAKPDAIFCASGDLSAAGVMASAKKHGMRIPDDLAVIGFDDAVYSAFFDPPLTTIKQPIDILGANALDIAIDAIEGKLKSFKHIFIEPELIIRESA